MERYGVVRMPLVWDVVDKQQQDRFGYKRVSPGHTSPAAAWKVADKLNQGKAQVGLCAKCGATGVTTFRCRYCRGEITMTELKRRYRTHHI